MNIQTLTHSDIMKNIHYHSAFFLLLLFVVGCGGNPTVSGRVTFTDGTPLDHGEVLFETPNLLAKGNIQSDGTYTMYTGELKGVPRGTYAVSIGGFQDTMIPPGNSPDGRPLGPPQFIPAVIPIAQKYLSPGTSELTCEVKGRTTYDITVEPPER